MPRERKIKSRYLNFHQNRFRNREENEPTIEFVEVDLERPGGVSTPVHSSLDDDLLITSDQRLPYGIQVDEDFEESDDDSISRPFSALSAENALFSTTS